MREALLCLCGLCVVCMCMCVCNVCSFYNSWLVVTKMNICVQFDVFAGIYEIFSGNKKFYFGKQPELIEGTDSVSVTLLFADLFQF